MNTETAPDRLGTAPLAALRCVGWLAHKDLVSERRAGEVWPTMLLVGVLVVLLFGMSLDPAAGENARWIGSLQWMATYFAGVVALGRSFTLERDHGCWQGLLLYPVSPIVIYWGKLAVNVVSLAALQCVLVPLSIGLTGVSLLNHPWHLLLVAALGNLGIASAGTLLAALAAGVRQGSSLLALLVLPVIFPVILAASAATRLLAENDIGPNWWRWIRLLIAFAVIFVTAGVALFEFALEE